MTLDLNPKTRAVAAATIKPGHIILESHEHPAQITRVTRAPHGRLNLFARFIWQASREPDWLLGTFQPRALIERAVKR